MYPNEGGSIVNYKRLLACAAATVVAATALVAGTAGPALAISTCNSMTYTLVRGTTDDTRIAPVYVNPSNWSYTFTCQLRQGNTGDGVKALQRSLRYCYGYGLTLDGIFGSNTRNALVNTQRRVGTSADGVYGPNTRRAMKHAPDDFTLSLGCKYIN